MALPATLLELVCAGPEQWHSARQVAGTAEEQLITWPAADRRLLAPLPTLRKNVFAVGLNYADHAAESGAAPTRHELVYFSKAATAVAGPDGMIVVDPRVTRQLDWEVELGVVIGIGGRWIDRSDALDHVFGYTVINDLSARDLQHDRPEGQWFLGKSLDGSCPMGPALVSADDIPDPQTLELSLRVNDVIKQHSTTAHMIADVALIISDLSKYVTLQPGDVIATGTPAGVGGARQPPEFLQPGDTMEAFIDAIGTLRTHVVTPAIGEQS